MSRTPRRLELNISHRPSADHLGARSSPASSVSCSRVPCARSNTQISRAGTPGSWRATASRVPSGEKLGCVYPAGSPTVPDRLPRTVEDPELGQVGPVGRLQVDEQCRRCREPAIEVPPRQGEAVRQHRGIAGQASRRDIQPLRQQGAVAHEHHVTRRGRLDVRLHGAERRGARSIDRCERGDELVLAIRQVDKVATIGQRRGPDMPELARRAIELGDVSDRPALDADLGDGPGRPRREQNDIWR